MKRKMLIKYKSIFKYEKHKETKTYKEVGEYTKNQTGTRIFFSTKDGNIEIRRQKHRVWLTSSSSTLLLELHKRKKNIYQTPYGDIHIETHLESLEEDENMKIKYSLWDQNSCISQVYILVQIQTLEN